MAGDEWQASELPPSVEKLSFMKLVSCAKKVGDCWSRRPMGLGPRHWPSKKKKFHGISFKKHGHGFLDWDPVILLSGLGT